jgi:hypothetical protein
MKTPEEVATEVWDRRHYLKPEDMPQRFAELVEAIYADRAQRPLRRLDEPDLTGSASSQHYIDTGQRLTHGEVLAQQARDALSTVEEAGRIYQAAIGEDGEGGEVKDYENYEDARLAFADSAEHILRQLAALDAPEEDE